MKEEENQNSGCSATLPGNIPIECPQESYPREIEIKKVSVTQKPNERKGTWKYTISFESARQLTIHEVFAAQNEIIPEYKFIINTENIGS